MGKDTTDQNYKEHKDKEYWDLSLYPVDGRSRDRTGTSYMEYAEKGFIDMSHYPILRMHVVKRVSLKSLFDDW